MVERQTAILAELLSLLSFQCKITTWTSSGNSVNTFDIIIQEITNFISYVISWFTNII